MQDNGGTANGGVDLDPTPKTMTIDVTATPVECAMASPSNQLVDQALASEDNWT